MNNSQTAEKRGQATTYKAMRYQLPDIISILPSVHSESSNSTLKSSNTGSDEQRKSYGAHKRKN